MKNFSDKKAIIIILILLVIGCLAAAVSYSVESPGKTVVVRVDGTETAGFSITDTITYRIETESGWNLLVISDGEVYILDADCPDKLCVGQGKIDENGESLICLPHKLVVEVRE